MYNGSFPVIVGLITKSEDVLRLRCHGSVSEITSIPCSHTVVVVDSKLCGGVSHGLEDLACLCPTTKGSRTELTDVEINGCMIPTMAKNAKTRLQIKDADDCLRRCNIDPTLEDDGFDSVRDEICGQLWHLKYDFRNLSV